MQGDIILAETEKHRWISMETCCNKPWTKNFPDIFNKETALNKCLSMQCSPRGWNEGKDDHRHLSSQKGVEWRNQ